MWPESSGCSQLQGGSGESLPRWIHALGSLRSPDASRPLGARAGQSSAQPRPGCLARSRPAGTERALRLCRKSFPGLDCLPGGGREEWMEVASRGARHPVYPALNSSSRPAAGCWPGEGDERLLAPLPANCHWPCPEMVPNTRLAYPWGGHG